MIAFGLRWEKLDLINIFGYSKSEFNLCALES